MSSLGSRLAPGETIPRHIHDEAYAAVVLDGGYEEAGERGRWRVRAGDVLLHGRFSGHWNHRPGKALVLNLPLAGAPDLPAPMIAHGLGDAVEVGAVMMLMAAWG